MIRREEGGADIELCEARTVQSFERIVRPQRLTVRVRSGTVCSDGIDRVDCEMSAVPKVEHRESWAVSGDGLDTFVRQSPVALNVELREWTGYGDGLDRVRQLIHSDG